MATKKQEEKVELTMTEKLELFKSSMPFKWREQSVNAQGATMVAYIDARQLYDKLDEVVGINGWQSDFRLIDGKLFGGIGIKTIDEANGYHEWIWKWDTGSESNVEKEKGEVSDSLKRAGIQWGVGRFLYSLGIVKLKSANYNGKYKPADDSGNIIWDKDKLSELCHQAIKEGVLDRTKIKPKTPAQKTTSDTTAKPPTGNKPPLILNSEQYNTVVVALKNKSRTMSQVIGYYDVSSDVKKALESAIK